MKKNWKITLYFYEYVFILLFYVLRDALEAVAEAMLHSKEVAECMNCIEEQKTHT